MLAKRSHPVRENASSFEMGTARRRDRDRGRGYEKDRGGRDRDRRDRDKVSRCTWHGASRALWNLEEGGQADA